MAIIMTLWIGNGAVLKIPIVPNYRGVCLHNTSKPHSYHLKIWLLS